MDYSGLTRRVFFKSLIAPLSAQVGSADRRPVQKWYIVGGHTSLTDHATRTYRDDCQVPPIVTYGRDIMEALENSGITVMPAERYGDYWDSASCQLDRLDRK